jgi:hypothetical protein
VQPCSWERHLIKTMFKGAADMQSRQWLGSVRVVYHLFVVECGGASTKLRSAVVGRVTMCVAELWCASIFLCMFGRGMQLLLLSSFLHVVVLRSAVRFDA